MAIEFTRQQQKVLHARGHNVLVSAAAGSGKTAVLVERIIREISEPGPGGRQPLDIDRLLVVTFTRAAAAQMREKIAKAVSKKLEEDPENRHLQRQETLLHHAQITTIDSFCTFLLRNNFSEIGLDPGFRQMDETENTLLENDVMQRFLEEKYTEKPAGFLQCVEYFCPGSSDAALENLILRLYRTADSHPYPAAWLQEHSHDYDVISAEDLLQKDWYVSMLAEQAEELPEMLRLQRAMIQIAEEPDGPFPYLDILEREEGELSALVEKAVRMTAGPGKSGEGKSWQQKSEEADDEAGKQGAAALREALLAISNYSPAKLPVIRGAEKQGISKDKKERVQALHKQLKSRLDTLGKAVSEDPALTAFRMTKAAGPVRFLTELTLEYMDALAQEKKKRNAISFSDLEHDALDILIDRAEDGTLTLRKAAEEYRRHFAEVLVDEYQDSNEVQELLLSAITGEKDAGFAMEGPGHYARFMVGDVKQSIYRFRNARPEIFQKKFDTYQTVGDESAAEKDAGGNGLSVKKGTGEAERYAEKSAGEAERSAGRNTAAEGVLRERIDLDQNFRSRVEVLDAVNGVFNKIMRREIGGVEYDDTVSLKPGAQYPEAVPERDGSDPYQAELLIVDGAVGGEQGAVAESAGRTGTAESGLGGRSGSSGTGGRSGSSEGGRSGSSAGDAEDTIEDEIAELSNHRKEALAVAQRIREIVGKLPVTDPDSGEQRMARYGDIVILLRSTSGRQDAFREIFEKEGIPLYLEYKGGYFSAEEVRQVLQVLRVIDNPRQDIPLYGAMRGFFGGFTQDEIGQIRALGQEIRRRESMGMQETGADENSGEQRRQETGAEGKSAEQGIQGSENLLYDCLLACAGMADVPEYSGTETERQQKGGSIPESSGTGAGENAGTKGTDGAAGENGGEIISPALQEKCRTFLAWLASYRRKVPTTPIHELIGGLIRSTGYEDYVRALPAGQRRAANLHSLLVKAAAFEQTDYAGLFRFLRYIDQMHEFDVDYGEASALDEHADVVRLTTIHKSKGLEYPICFVCGLGARHPFSRDLSGILITDSDMGIGVNYVDTDLRSQTSTLRQRAIADKIARDALGEELRVLYVAMTRAKEKLILTGFVRDASKYMENTAAQVAAAELPASHLPVSLIRGASGYLQLVMESILAMEAEGKEPIHVHRVPVSDLALSKVEDQMTMGQMKETLVLLENGGLERLPVPTLAEKLSSYFSWRYSYENMTGLFTKTTVSELKHAAMVDAGVLEEDRAPEGPQELYPDRAFEAGREDAVNREVEADGEAAVNRAFEADGEAAAGREVEVLPKPRFAEGTALRCSQDNQMTEKSTGAGTGHGTDGAAAGSICVSPLLRGTAVHKMCELIDYQAWTDPSRVTAQEFRDRVNELAGKGKIPPEYGTILRAEVFLPFLRSGIAKRMAEADAKGRLRREQPFVLGIPASRLSPDFPAEETILIQGIIDAFFIEEDGAGEKQCGRHIVVVDYKTDRVRTSQQLIERYRVQLDYYAEALEKMLHLPVTEKMIYSFTLQQEIRVE